MNIPKTYILILFIGSSINGYTQNKKANLDYYLKIANLGYGSAANTTNSRSSVNALSLVCRQLLGQWNTQDKREETRITTLFEFTGNEAELKALDVNIHMSIANIYTADFPIKNLDKIASVPGMVSLEMTRLARTELDASREMVKVNQAHASFPQRGNGVIIGFLDTGIDIKHPTFKDSNGKTRIISIWDQSDDRGTRPVGFTYGREWTSASIDNGTCTHKDVDGHGTNTASIAAGSGQSSTGQTAYIGMAPASSIIMVSVRGYTSYTGAYFTQTTGIIEGIKYIADKAKAQNKPWVANLSLGLETGPHNGSSLFERAIQAFITDNNYGTGRIIVKSAGNFGYATNTFTNEPETAKAHADNIGPGQKEFRIKDNQGSQTGVLNSAILEIYYPTNSNYSVKLTSPNGVVYGPVEKNKLDFIESNDGLIIIDNFSSTDLYYKGTDAICTINFNDYDPNGDKVPDKNLVNGTWKIEMLNSQGEWDVYAKPDNGNTQIFFENNSYSNRRVITEPGNAPSVITVGSVNSKNTWPALQGYVGYVIPEVSYFSSPGPTRSGLGKPELMAPGAFVASALSSNESKTDSKFFTSNSQYFHKKGTSLSAPHVSGVIALLFEKWNVTRQQNYGYNQIIDILLSSSSNGILNAYEALKVDEPVTGIEDDVKISSSGGLSPLIISPNTSNHYRAYFYDVDPTGDYSVSYSWRIELYHSGGSYVAASASTGAGTSSDWYVNISDQTLPNHNWIRDADGNVKGQVIVNSLDNDGILHEDFRDIGLRLRPNQPIIYSGSASGSSITLSYIAAGATTYKVYYGLSGGVYNGTGATQGNSPINTSSSSTTITNLAAGSTYYVAVTAANTYGESVYSQELKVSPEVLSLQNQTITSGQEIYVNANSAVQLAGNNSTYIVTGGASVMLTACNSIVLKPGFIAQYGSNVRIFPKPCYSTSSTLVFESVGTDVISQEEGDFEIYPNPTSGLFHISLSSESSQNIQITDVLGNVIVTNDNLTSGLYHFDLTGYAKGVYFITIYNSKERRLVTKRVINR